jgi:hypothetical protein
MGSPIEVTDSAVPISLELSAGRMTKVVETGLNRLGLPAPWTGMRWTRSAARDQRFHASTRMIFGEGHAIPDAAGRRGRR